MIIYLLRHGIAADNAADGSYSDEGRPLSEDGRKKLNKALQAYRKLMLPPDRILASPLLRAQQTAELLRESLGSGIEIESTPALHHSVAPTAILEQLQGDLLEDVGSIALVGHEPHLGNLFGLLLSSSSRRSIPLSMGMMVAIEVLEAQAMTGRLVFCISQKEARKLG
ncbi:MAG: phosphohistidine phosphatase SixA [Planctomycetota bacterium]|jgi:phosphohistidine phosphatase